MAQNIVKSIKTNKPPKQSGFSLERLPEVKLTAHQPKIIQIPEKEKQRVRAGFVPGGINLKGKPSLIENGKKIK